MRKTFIHLNLFKAQKEYLNHFAGSKIWLLKVMMYLKIYWTYIYRNGSIWIKFIIHTKIKANLFAIVAYGNLKSDFFHFSSLLPFITLFAMSHDNKTSLKSTIIWRHLQHCISVLYSLFILAKIVRQMFYGNWRISFCGDGDHAIAAYKLTFSAFQFCWQFQWIFFFILSFCSFFIINVIKPFAFGFYGGCHIQ